MTGIITAGLYVPLSAVDIAPEQGCSLGGLAAGFQGEDTRCGDAAQGICPPQLPGGLILLPKLLHSCRNGNASFGSSSACMQKLNEKVSVCTAWLLLQTLKVLVIEQTS